MYDSALKKICKSGWAWTIKTLVSCCAWLVLHGDISYFIKIFVEMEFLKKCCQCFCFSECACNAACCIDVWHSCEAFGMACLYCDSCCWTLCAPLCIDCKIGDSGKAMESCSKCVRYCIFGCALDCVGICDGIYNCVQIIKQTCGG